jgi:PP-loop superfamily ATP-utilizing enzyme
MDEAWKNRNLLSDICRKSGFNYVSIDLSGYRTGSMNEVLSESDRNNIQK